MVRNLVARVGAMRWAKPAALAAIAVALMALGGFGTYAVQGQPGGLLAGSGGVQAQAATGSGSDSLCGQTAFATGDANPPIAIAASPTTAVLLTANLSHNCTGLVHVAFSSVFDSAGGQIGFRIDATCTGGGCPVTGVPIVAEPYNSTPLDLTVLTSSVVNDETFASTGTFPNLPRGRYTITARATRTGASAASQVQAMYAQAYGPPTPALP